MGGIVFSVTRIFLDVRKKKTLMEYLARFWPWHASDIQVGVLLIRRVCANKLGRRRSWVMANFQTWP